MKIVSLNLFVVIGLMSCSGPEVSNVEYNKGQQRAEMEGCHCNSALPRTGDPEIARQGKGWTDGYVDACIRFRREQDC